MSSLFEKQLEHYKSKFHETRKVFKNRDLELFKARYSITDLEKELRGNTDTFKQFILTYANIMPGRVSCTTYAAAVSRVADELGIGYTAYAGFCMPTSFPKYDEDKAAWQKKHDEGEEHPMFPTHVYLEIDDVIYEYYNGEEDVDHIDVVEI